MELHRIRHEIEDRRGRHLRDLRISVTDRCNFRCPYCMPAELFGEHYQYLSKSEILTFEEIGRLAELFIGLGVTKIRLTGGEPLLRAKLPNLVGLLASISGELDLALTTNGYLLQDQAKALYEAGLKRVTVSLDGHDQKTFQQMSGRQAQLDRVLKGIDAAAEVGLTPLKVNTVIRRGVNEDAIVPLAERFRGSSHIIRFIEFMDVGTKNGWDITQVVPASEIVRRVNEAFPIEPVEAHYSGEVANRYRYCDGEGEIGVIASVTQPFCGECTRARLTADGKLVTCLFANSGFDLKRYLRDNSTDDEITAQLLRFWRRRDDRYSEIRSKDTAQSSEVDANRIEMYQIGG